MIMRYDIAIIGAGAAGLPAAIAAARKAPGLSVALLERNAEAGRKILATGNGRCNYLNKNAMPADYASGAEAEPGACSDKAESKKPYDAAETKRGVVDCGLGPDKASGSDCRDFVAEVFSQENPERLIEFFQGLGIEPAEEEDGRLYPRSRQAASVREALLSGADEAGVKLFTAFHVTSLERDAEGFLVFAEDGRCISCRRVVLATGGKAGIQYGSSGEGYKMAMALGIPAVKPVPALTMLVCAEEMEPIFGVRAEGRICLLRRDAEGERIVAADRGVIQFAREGISGICCFNLSRYYRISEGIGYSLQLDFFEEYMQDALRQLLLKRRDRFFKRTQDALFLGLLPEKLGLYLLLRQNCAGRRGYCSALTDGDIASLSALAKALPFTVVGSGGWKEAQVTAGGIALGAVDPKSLEALTVPGLYLAGEILDVDGPCGGYNLSWAFASGLVAGRSAVRSLTEN